MYEFKWKPEIFEFKMKEEEEDIQGHTDTYSNEIFEDIQKQSQLAFVHYNNCTIS